jgi:hypothetical protein
MELGQGDESVAAAKWQKFKERCAEERKPLEDNHPEMQRIQKLIQAQDKQYWLQLANGDSTKAEEMRKKFWADYEKETEMDAESPSEPGSPIPGAKL